MKCPGLSFFGLLLVAAGQFSYCSPFDVFWNAPSESCTIHFGINVTRLLRTFGVKVNNGEQFLGDAITIFYDSRLGRYPHITDKEDVNGGLPQVANLTRHLQVAADNISRTIPSHHWNGLGVIDWESWRPVWEFNWGKMNVYHQRSIELVQKQHPDWPMANITEKAKEDWEYYAKVWMLDTLILTKDMRPNGRWCYYLFPDCYNYEGQKPEDFTCSPNIRKGNDKLDWLWTTSTALCPSIYLYESHLKTFSFDQRVWFTYGRLQESLRVSRRHVPVYPYVNYAMSTGKMVPPKEFSRMIGQVASLGMQGAVIWGSSASVSSKDSCQSLNEYILTVLGPTVEKVAWNVERCKKSVCNNHGHCTWPKALRYSSWKFFVDKDDDPFYAGDIVCRCESPYSGRYCENNGYMDDNMIFHFIRENLYKKGYYFSYEKLQSVIY